jgi:uncharacterized protein involved in exopolysaccharide biosynthesis
MELQDDNIVKPSLADTVLYSVMFWYKHLFKKWIYIILFSFFGCILGITYAWLTPAIYTAEMSFSSETDGQSKIGGYAGIAASFGFDIGGGGNAFEGENLIDFFKSKTLIEKTLYTKINLNSKPISMLEYYLRCRKKNADWNKDTLLSNLTFETGLDVPLRTRDSIVKVITDEILKSSLKIEKRDKKLVTIDAAFSDIDEYFAKSFLESLANNAIKYYVDYKCKKAKANVDLITHQVDSISNILRGNITSVAVSNDVNINPIKQGGRIETQRKQVDVQANTGAYVELLKQLALAKLNLNKETPLIQIIDNPKFPLKKKKSSRLLMCIQFGIFFGFLVVLFLIVKKIVKDASFRFRDILKKSD